MQQDQKIADFLRNFVGNDGHGGDDTQSGVGHERGGDQDAIHKVVHRVADHDHRAAAAVIVGICVMIMRFALLGVTVAPQHQFLEHEKQKNAEQYHRGEPMHARGLLECMRQDFEEHRAEQGTDGVADQHRDACRGCAQCERGRSQYAKNRADNGRSDNPGKGGHERRRKMRD